MFALSCILLMLGPLVRLWRPPTYIRRRPPKRLRPAGQVERPGTKPVTVRTASSERVDMKISSDATPPISMNLTRALIGAAPLFISAGGGQNVYARAALRGGMAIYLEGD